MNTEKNNTKENMFSVLFLRLFDGTIAEYWFKWVGWLVVTATVYALGRATEARVLVYFAYFSAALVLLYALDDFDKIVSVLGTKLHLKSLWVKMIAMPFLFIIGLSFVVALSDAINAVFISDVQGQVKIQQSHESPGVPQPKKEIPAKSHNAAEVVASKPFVDQAVWGAAPTLLWILFLTGLIWSFRQDLRNIIWAIVSRLRDGAAFKLVGLEIGASSGLVAMPGDFSKEDSRIGVYMDESGPRANERANLYAEYKGVMLVHRLQRSKHEGQLYDILIYVIPHKSCSLAAVSKIEYFFGHYWGNKVYPSSDRSRGFPVVTSAYGPFLCTARVIFNDGSSATLYRYIDFEMGNLAQQFGVQSNG